MPIAQDRLIKLVANADVLLDVVEELKKDIKDLVNFTRLASDLNTSLSHCEDQGSKELMQEFMQTMRSMYYRVMSIDIPTEVKNNIMEERIHFKVHRKANETLANYMRYKRTAIENMKTSKAEIEQFFSPEIEAIEKGNATDTPQEMRKIKEKIGIVPFSESDLRYKKAMEDFAKLQEKRNGKETTEELRENSIEESIEEPITSGAEELAILPESKGEQEKPPITSPGYGDGVIATSRPSNEELYKPDLEPGSNVL